MKYAYLIFLVLLFGSCQGQNAELLINQEITTDFAGSPLYQRMTVEENGKSVWKKRFRYMDSIDVYRITYMSDGLKINGFLVKPKKKGNYPCIIYNRGGSGDFGALQPIHGALTLGRLAKEGYVLIASQYRGNGGSEGQESFGGDDINDVLVLTEVLKEVESADTERIGMYGWSRGGLMTYLALTKSDRIKAAVVGGAVADCHDLVADRSEMETEVLAKYISAYQKNRNAELDRRSPIKKVDRFPKETPILILHGNADWRVKPEQSLKMAMEFEKHRIPYRLIMFEGGDHGISEHRREMNEQILNWFNKYLKGDGPLPNMEYHGR